LTLSISSKLNSLILTNSAVIDKVILFCVLVTGEANFSMPCTCLTIGGFTQPGVARALIELPSNAEKGLSHCFLWLFPKPLFGKFSNLGEVDKEFQLNMGKHTVW